MSIVFVAQDLRIQRKVALKVLRPELTESIGAKRFLREIEIAANLEHPNILPLFDSGEADGLLYYTMPFVEGESLRDRLEREGPLSLDAALQIAKEVGEALAYAHEHGVVHRDIKPENILLASGIARVADFGIARARTEAGGFESITDANLAIGTPEYMSPEQASGSEAIDGRTDIYSLGCVLYEMLAGEPPFTGRTVQAIIAKQLGEKVPTLTVLRPGISLKVAKVIERALAKVPADRYATPEKFLESLDRTQKSADVVPVVVALAAVVVVVGTVLGIWSAVTEPNSQPLNRDWVMGFPLATMGLSTLSPEVGEIAAHRIGAALEGTEPFVWRWGWDWLSSSDRADVGSVPAQTMDSIARSRRARFRVSGTVVETGAEASVTLVLHDVMLDSTLEQRTARGRAHPDSVLQLALQAGRQILPDLIGPERELDLAAFQDRDLAATALWMQGEVEYSRSRFVSALDLYRRAVRLDSGLTMAALKGAQAASWNKIELGEARRLVQLALRSDSALPPKYRDFGRGLNHYLDGNADSAVVRLRSALAADRGWSEAWMALAEVYYHLIPNDAPLDSLAEAAFNAAWENDTTFSPPLYHLAEIALRKNDFELANRLINRFGESDADSTLMQPLELALECLRVGPDRMDWERAIQDDPDAVARAAKMLSGHAANPSCAEPGFRRLFENQSLEARKRWGALLGLHGLLIAQGKYDQAEETLEAGLAARFGAVHSLYVFDAICGAPFDSQAARAEAIARRGAGEYYERTQPYNRWLLGVWQARQGNLSKVARISGDLDSIAAGTGNRRDQIDAAALRVHLALARGRIDRAEDMLVHLASTAPHDYLTWELDEPLAIERLLHAELLLERGAFAEAHRVASAFDHHGPVAFLPLLPASLSLRIRAAESMNRPDLARIYDDRLTALGWEETPPPLYVSQR